jgi:hypothetical protein
MRRERINFVSRQLCQAFWGRRHRTATYGKFGFVFLGVCSTLLGARLPLIALATSFTTAITGAKYNAAVFEKSAFANSTVAQTVRKTLDLEVSDIQLPLLFIP